MLPLSPLFIPSLGIGELALVLVLVLLLFGPGKLPKVAESLGEAVKRFRHGSETSGSSTSVSSASHPPTLENSQTDPEAQEDKS